VGHEALFKTQSTHDNTAVGYGTLYNNIGIDNTATGASALLWNTTGSSNTAFGYQALFNSAAGHRNVALGHQAGYNATTGSDNVYIANQGVGGESGSIYLGTAGTHTKTVVAGIYDTAVSSGRPVVIDSDGQLGTTPPGSPLSVAGVIHSTVGGFKFPDGTTQTTATAIGPAGPVGPACPTSYLSRVAFDQFNKQFTGAPGPPIEVGSLTIDPGGSASETMFVKVDAMIHASYNISDLDVWFYITHDESGLRSPYLRFQPAMYGGTPGSITWVALVQGGAVQTFRLFSNPDRRPPNCAEFNSCGNWNIDAAVSAISAPYGASGGKTLK
jgi:hypothetical protein